MISVILVILVVFAFLRTFRATLIPSVAVPLSLVGTFGVMYLLGYSLDNLSLMALAISTGFVVDDAIVVLENITRHIEEGMAPVAGGVSGRPRDWLYRALHEHVAGRGIHSHSADGWNRRPPVPGVCGHAERGHRGFAAGVSHRDADDVREIPALGGQEKSTAASIASAKRSLIRILNLYSRALKLVLAPPAADPADHDRDRRAERLSLHHRSQGFLSAAGYGAHSGVGSSRTGHFVRCHEGKDDAVCRPGDERSGGRDQLSDLPAATLQPTRAACSSR